MSLLVDVRFFLHRAIGLLRRGSASLRNRGLRATWHRASERLRQPRIAAPALYFPEDAPFAPFAVPQADAPRASIVIPVYNQFAHTLRCLRALAGHPPSAACEILVVDDGSSDATATALRQVTGLRYHRRDANGGFIAACNDGAALARGDILVFLNNDTVPQPGWLDALLATFEQHARVGIAGAQLLYPDGRLQEAGGVVFADGSAWNYGRFGDPADALYGYVRDADYVSGAALAIPAALFRSLGGFDTRYAPAYYEDTDLAFAVRDAGRRVLYQPAARVMHDEGATAGTDPSGGAKAAQVRNQAVFQRKWEAALARHVPAGEPPSPASLHGSQPQLLIVDALTPRPDHDSGSLRLVHLMQLLREEGAHVVFLPANRSEDGHYTRELQAMGVECWHAPWAERAPAWLARHGHRFDCALLSRHYVASEFLPLLRRHAPQARVVFDSVDLHYLRERREAELSGDAAALRRALATRARELATVSAADATLVVSDAERDLLARDAPGASVHVLSNLHRLGHAGLPFAERKDLVFVGGFRHPPNVDGVQWFVHAIVPLLRGSLPNAVFHCIGGHVPESIAALASVAGVRVHGHVPDIDPYMDGCRVAVAPLRYGAGVKGKVNLSMAHGQPVVATSCAVEGMHLVDGADVLVADDPAAFADAIVRLYRDQALWDRLSANGLANIERHFSFDAARDTVRKVLLRQPAA